MILLMVQTITLCNLRIAKMYEQLGLTQDDIFHKTKLLLSIYRDVVWATLADCNCVNEEIYYYGDDLTDALAYLEEFAPDIERSEFERQSGALPLHQLQKRQRKLSDTLQRQVKRSLLCEGRYLLHGYRTD